MLDSERSKLGKEVVDLQARVAKDEEKEEEGRRHAFDLKQKVGVVVFFNWLHNDWITLSSLLTKTLIFKSKNSFLVVWEES